MDFYQEIAANVIRKGHNLVLCGQAGTGKTHLIRCITNEMRLNNQFQVVCYTGMACQQYPQAITLHKFAGLEDGRSTKEELLHLILTDERYESTKKRIISTDILFIDEVSMVSARIFNHVEYIFRNVRDKRCHFGGMQIILVGDFMQLPPIKDELYGDHGKFCFEVPFFDGAFPHRINLTHVHRQAQPELFRMVNELERGEPTEETNILIQSLSRPLVTDPDKIVKLFARNLDVDIYNFNQLQNLNSPLFTFLSEDQGDTYYLNKMTAPKILGLKVGCPVLLIKNIDSKLVNGLQGVVHQLTSSSVEVNFQIDVKSINVPIQKFTFTKYDPSSKTILAQRRQFPLRLAYGLTIHKSQGMSINHVEVDCNHAHYPGQIGVAVGRAVSLEGLRILNYRPSLCRKHPDKVYKFVDSCNNEILLDSVSCCCKLTIDQELEVHLSEDEETESISDHSDSDISEIENDEGCIDLLDETKENELEKYVEIHPDCQILLELAVQDYIGTPVEDDILEKKRFLMERRDLSNWFEEQRNNIQEIMDSTLKLDLKKVEMKHLTEFYTKFNLYMNSDQFLQSSIVNECTSFRPILTSIMFELQKQLLKQRSSFVEILQTEEINIKPTENDEISMSGRGKIRYIGGYVVAKCRYNLTAMMRNSLFVAGMEVEVKKLQQKIQILDGFIISEAELKECTFYEDTLEETSRKQNVRQGLININDKCFEFFEFLELEIRKNLTYNKLMDHHRNLFQVILNQLSENTSLLETFIKLYCFTRPAIEIDHEEESDAAAIIFETSGLLTDTVCNLEDIFNYISNLFLKVAVAQFRKDYLNTLKVKKGKALRKKIMEKGNKGKDRGINMKLISEDKSDNKIVSHLRLKAEVLENEFFYKNFTKMELQEVGKLYGLSLPSKKTVAEIGDELRKTISECSYMSIPTTSKAQKKQDTPTTSTVPTDEANQPTVEDQAMDEGLQPQPEKRKGTVSRKGKGKRKKRSYSTRKKRVVKKVTEVNETCDEKTCDTQNLFCSICGKFCSDDQDCICCDTCSGWYHRQCIPVLKEDKVWEEMSVEEAEFICPMCD